jgi:hypothetical protein
LVAKLRNGGGVHRSGEDGRAGDENASIRLGSEGRRFGVGADVDLELNRPLASETAQPADLLDGGRDECLFDGGRDECLSADPGLPDITSTRSSLSSTYSISLSGVQVQTHAGPLVEAADHLQQSIEMRPRRQ